MTKIPDAMALVDAGVPDMCYELNALRLELAQAKRREAEDSAVINDLRMHVGNEQSRADKLAARVETLEEQEAQLVIDFDRRTDILNEHIANETALEKRVKTLERLETELQEAVNQAVGMANDHAAELLELAANNARMRETAINYRDAFFQSQIVKSNLELNAVLAETPIQSLAAITAPLEAHIADLKGALEVLSCLGNEPHPGNSKGNVIAQQALAKSPAESLKAIRAADAQEIESLKAHVKTLEDALKAMPCHLMHSPEQVHLCGRCKAMQVLAAKEPTA